MSNKRGTMSKPWRKSTPPSVGDIPRRKHEQMVTLTAYQALEKEVKELKDGETNLIKELANRWAKVQALEKELKKVKAECDPIASLFKKHKDD